MRNPPVPWSRPAGLHLAFLAAVGTAPWLECQEAPTELALVGAHVHPVSGPAIENGVVLVRGDRIVAVGPREEVEIPASATLLSFPRGHIYPGLVDAMVDAFADSTVLDDNSTDAGTPISWGLDRHQAASQKLVTYGITTAYVSNRGNVQWRGIGAVLRPQSDGYQVFPDIFPKSGEAAVQMRLTGRANIHPLNRQKALASAGDAFDAIEAYEKRFADHDKALAEYQEEYEKYLAHHRGREGTANPAGEAQRGGDTTARRGGRGFRRGRRRGAGAGQGEEGRRGRGPGGRRSGAEATGTSQEQVGEAGEEEEQPEAAPTKPDYPEAPAREPDKEALSGVLKGERPLRIEAQRAGEIRAALRVARDHEIRRMTLEHAAEAGTMAADLALQGIPVVISNVLPGTTPEAYGGGDGGELSARLASSGVAVAIASGTVSNARHLPLVAAYAVGKGLDRDTALRAITLTAAEILGVSREVGSLEPGKLADIVVFSAPIFASDAVVLRVLSAGTTQYEGR